MINNSSSINTSVLLIRTDANEKVGIGHLMRCLTISRFWKQRGRKMFFLMTPLTASMENFLKPYHLDLKIQQENPGSRQDAATTLALATECEATWIIADGYWFGPEFQEIVVSGSSKLLLIDPLGTPQRNIAHIIVNANIYANQDYYRQRSEDTKLLLGPKYLPLRPEFTSMRTGSIDRSTPPKNIFISLGGADPGNVTEHVLQTLLGIPDLLRLTVVIGPANENFTGLQRLAQKSSSRIILLQSPDNMPELMLEADIAVLAGGSTVWEALFMGLPVVLLSYADNQLRVGPRLGQLGYALYSGHFNGLVPDKFHKDLAAMLEDSSLRCKLSERGRQLIDGKGTERIIQAMMT